MKSEKTIKAELEAVEKQTEKYCADYGAGYKAGLKFCLEPTLPISRSLFCYG